MDKINEKEKSYNSFFNEDKFQLENRINFLKKIRI
jgi:hypothetical protein